MIHCFFGYFIFFSWLLPFSLRCYADYFLIFSLSSPLLSIIIISHYYFTFRWCYALSLSLRHCCFAMPCHVISHYIDIYFLAIDIYYIFSWLFALIDIIISICFRHYAADIFIFMPLACWLRRHAFSSLSSDAIFIAFFRFLLASGFQDTMPPYAWGCFWYYGLHILFLYTSLRFAAELVSFFCHYASPFSLFRFIIIDFRFLHFFSLIFSRYIADFQIFSLRLIIFISLITTFYLFRD